MIRSATFQPARPSFIAGEELAGRIDFRAKPWANQDLKVALICILLGHERERSEALVWADDEIVPASRVTRVGEWCRIPVVFQLPGDLRSGPRYQWHLAVYARGRRRYTFGVSIDARDRYETATAIPVMERRIKAIAPGKGRIAVGGGRLSYLPLQYIVAALFLVLIQVCAWLGRAPRICSIAFLAFSVVVVYSIYKNVRKVSHSAVEIEDGKIILSRGKSRLQEFEAKSVRAIDIVASEVGSAGPVYDVRLHTISSKIVIAAAFVSDRARAEQISRKLEDLLTGYDRNKIESLFGNPEGLNSTP